MVKKYRSRLGILTGSALMMLWGQPLQATLPTEVNIESSSEGIEIRLKSGSKKKSFVFNPDSAAKETTKDKVLIAQTSDVLVPNPEITIDDEPAPTVAPPVVAPTPEGTPPTMAPPTVAPAPPFIPRAVAPPVGDIAVSNIDASPDLIDLGTSAIVPRLVLRDAPAREVLAILSRFAGLNLVFTDQGATEGAAAGPTISLDIENESVQDVFNSVLLVSGLNANRKGNSIYVSPTLPDTARNLVSRTLRLNQVQANNAATFLATQGAEVQQVITPIQEVIDPETQRVVRREPQPPELRILEVTGAEESIAPLLLNGLKVSTDDRLNSITLVGEPSKVQIATSFLIQLDARRRQVAINVKVIDVNLLNTEDYNTSFSFGVNDSFFIQDNGSAALRFGEVSPPTTADLNSATGSVSNPPAIPNPFSGSNSFLDFDSSTIVPGAGRGVTIIDQTADTLEERFRQIPADAQFFIRRAGVSGNPFEAGITELTLGENDVITITEEGVEIEEGTAAEATAGLPSFFRFPDRFLALLEAQIVSGNAKILTDPTLVVQEGQEASVRLVQDVVTNIVTEVDPESGVRTTTPILGEAGLVLTVNIERIDDNGFVNLSASPVVSAVGEQQVFESGGGADNVLNLLNRRELSSGLLRLRDSQTLILSGIIQESDRTTISKVPILGDIPILGALFRSTNKNNERREVIILLTPQIVDENANFGYNYVPGTDARELLRNQGFTVPGNP